MIIFYYFYLKRILHLKCSETIQNANYSCTAVDILEDNGSMAHTQQWIIIL